MKTIARIVQRVNCPACGWPMKMSQNYEKPTCVCVTQGCKQVGIVFYAPVTEIALKPVNGQTV